MDGNKNIDPKLDAALKGVWDSLTDEQKEKAKACKTPDELTALAAKEGIELPDEVLDAVAGGYLYYAGYWEVIDDHTGRNFGNYNDKKYAEQVLRERGFSTEQISLDRINQIRADFERQNSKSGCF